MATEVSVVVPTHDRPNLLQLTLFSILRQRDVEIEVIVVDDGSEPPANDAVAGLRDPRLRVVRHGHPRGASVARNRGIAEAQGRWVAFCDDDDLWAPDKLSRQLESLGDENSSWAYTGVVRIDDHEVLRGGAPPPKPAAATAALPRWNSIDAGPSTVVVSGALLDEVGGFDPALRYVEDWDMWLRLGQQDLPACCPEPLVAYREHPSNMSLDVVRMTDYLRRMESRWGRVDRVAYHLWAADMLWTADRRAVALKETLQAAVSVRSMTSIDALARWVWGRTRGRHGDPPEMNPYLAAAKDWLDALLDEAPNGASGSLRDR